VRANFRTDNLQFYFDERTGSSYAALPVGRENASGAYELQVFSGDNTYTYTVNVTDGSSDGFLSAAVSDEDYGAFFTPNKLAKWEKTLSDLRASSDGTPMLNADLAFGGAHPNDVELEYGSSVLLGNEHAEDDAGLHTLEGIVIKADKGDEVEAIQSGICVFAGELGAGGNTVILDHGCGIFSYYYNLDTISIDVGDSILRSREIGTVGMSGYTQDDTPYLYYAMSIGEMYVNPLAE
jgi:murein DD-endopeptidase MepM/ murein hydrolase activator NlpD